MATRIGQAALVLATTGLLAACMPPTPPSRFEQWRTSPTAASAADYQDYLVGKGVADALPQAQLLRTGRRWRRCGEEFSVPPPATWPNMVATLRIVQQLRDEGLLSQAQAASVYRNAEFNRCEGGAARSRHVLNNAIDFDLQKSVGGVDTLCAWWRAQGPALKMGLGFYAPDKIHIDTSGFRTWGYDFSRKTSLCLKAAYE